MILEGATAFVPRRHRSGGEHVVVLTIDVEAAEYLADVVLSEWLRTGDGGAKDIHDVLDEQVRNIQRTNDEESDET